MMCLSNKYHQKIRLAFFKESAKTQIKQKKKKKALTFENELKLFRGNKNLF